MKTVRLIENEKLYGYKLEIENENDKEFINFLNENYKNESVDLELGYIPYIGNEIGIKESPHFVFITNK